MTTICKYIGIGKRKTSTAKVLLIEGTGTLKVNNISFDNYFSSKIYQKTYIFESIFLLKLKNKFDFLISVKGGGKSSQLDAIKLAISKALCNKSNEYHKKIAKANLLSTDARVKERRKYGLKKARKAAQYHKR
jgi:small subunit ribosomal protein S9